MSDDFYDQSKELVYSYSPASSLFLGETKTVLVPFSSWCQWKHAHILVLYPVTGTSSCSVHTMSVICLTFREIELCVQYWSTMADGSCNIWWENPTSVLGTYLLCFGFSLCFLFIVFKLVNVTNIIFPFLSFFPCLIKCMQWSLIIHWKKQENLDFFFLFEPKVTFHLFLNVPKNSNWIWVEYNGES